jgi:hypothetical protein
MRKGLIALTFAAIGALAFAASGGIAFGEVYLPNNFASPEVVEPIGEAPVRAGRIVAAPYEALVGAPLGNCQSDRQWTGYGWGWRNVEVCD